MTEINIFSKSPSPQYIVYYSQIVIISYNYYPVQIIDYKMDE